MYFLNHFETVPVAPIISGITSVFASHACFISVGRLIIVVIVIIIIIIIIIIVVIIIIILFIFTIVC